VKTSLRAVAVVLLLALARDARAFERRWGLELGLTPGVAGFGFDGGSYEPTAGFTVGLGYMVDEVFEVRSVGSAVPMRARASEAEGAGWLASFALGFRALVRSPQDSPWAVPVGLTFGAGGVQLSGRDGVARTFPGFAMSFEVGADRELSRDLALGLALRVAYVTIPSRSGLEPVDAMGVLVGPVLYVRRSWGF
jgi:hypothetical protein